MELTNKQKHHLRSLAHTLSPVVIIGNASLSQPVLSEIDRALDDHELVKVKINEADRETRRQIVKTICAREQALLVQSIGRVAIFYRSREKPLIQLPSANR